ncbi:hypothetical protein M5X17_31145 [Paenibacillus alvei]|uniref:hypothetical protein n=1 Tax=Paenibacillus alvei TaxID=44250 RepID=UPI0022826D5D|nr:hypothetical protein [Paenibacillus alvei]MCY9738150.1 hypothetical protein [Paenibacillus alvei]
MNKKLRVSHFPQVPCKPFQVEVKNLEEAKLISDTLALYDLFQYENKIKPDYANATVVEQWDEKDEAWTSWFDEATGIDDIDEYFESKSKTYAVDTGTGYFHYSKDYFSNKNGV